jgi:hypothetical protein
VCIICGGKVFIEQLPCNNTEMHIETHRLMEGFMKYAVEMGSGAMIYIPSFINIGSGIQKLMGGGYTEKQTAW